jgi:two-component system chemotaxis sensor kinase CheA
VEILEKLDGDIAAMAANPGDDETINSAFRALHTIKGNSSFLHFDQITRLGHAAETLLDKVRRHEIAVTPELIAVVRGVYEELGTMIREQEVNRDSLAMIAAIDRFMGSAPAELVAAAIAPEQKIAAAVNESITKIATTKFIRVDEAKLAKIVSLVSELEVTRYALEQLPDRLEALGAVGEELRFETELSTSKLTRLSKSLSGIVYGLRLLPVHNIFQRFPKVVQDLAEKLGKKMQLKILNGEAELDKNIIEAIADPMTHLIRNAADHGIESEAERIQAGKDPTGTVTLNSFVQGNFVFIEIWDDGRGIDPDKILKKAVEKGIVPPERAEELTVAQRHGLIFAPGFSTAESVTDISGRGVGMDVVKSNINKLKGTVIIDSTVGKGTVIRLRFPMSIAVLLALFVRIQDSICAFPMDQIDESYDFHKEDLLSSLPEGEDPANYMKLYSLRKLLWDDTEEQRNEYHVLRFRDPKGGYHIGFVVDEFVALEEAIMQSVDSYIAALPGVQGASVRKDGSVALLVSPMSLLEEKEAGEAFAYVKIKAKPKVQETGLSDFLGMVS